MLFRSSKPLALQEMDWVKEEGALAAVDNVTVAVTLPEGGTITEMVQHGGLLETPVGRLGKKSRRAVPLKPFLPDMSTLKTCWPPGSRMAGTFCVLEGVTTILMLPFSWPSTRVREAKVGATVSLPERLNVNRPATAGVAAEKVTVVARPGERITGLGDMVMPAGMFTGATLTVPL